MTPHETAVKIAEACMDAIEKRRGIIKDDLIEAARGVIAGNLSGPASGYPTAHYVTPIAWNAELAALGKARAEIANAMEKAFYPPVFAGLDIANGPDVTKVWIKEK